MKSQQLYTDRSGERLHLPEQSPPRRFAGRCMLLVVPFMLRVYEVKLKNSRGISFNARRYLKCDKKIQLSDRYQIDNAAKVPMPARETVRRRDVSLGAVCSSYKPSPELINEGRGVRSGIHSSSKVVALVYLLLNIDVAIGRVFRELLSLQTKYLSRRYNASRGSVS